MKRGRMSTASLKKIASDSPRLTIKSIKRSDWTNHTAVVKTSVNASVSIIVCRSTYRVRPLMGRDYRCDPNREPRVNCADSGVGAGSWTHAPRGYLIAPATLRLTARPDDRSDRHRESPRWSGHERGTLLERLRRAVPAGGAAGPVGGAATALRLSEPPRPHGPAGAAARLRGPAAVLRAALAGHPPSPHW